MSIQLFTPKFHVEECISEIRECLHKGWTGLGFKTVEFEKEWCKYTSLSHAHFLNSATVGLHLAIKILKQSNGWEDNDEVISTPLTFISTNHAISYERMHITFADVDQHLCLEPEDVLRKITPKTRAILFVGLAGNIGQWDKIVKIARDHNLKLILDAAHMSGTRVHGDTPGKDADVIVYSFQAVKNLATADSGMICFKDAESDALVRKLSWLGINKDTFERISSKGAYKWKYDVESIGFKYHGNSIMAAIALAQLPYLDQENAYRRQIASWYDDGFKKNEKSIRPVPVAKFCESSRHLYIIEVEHRDELLMALNDCEIYPGVHYRDNTEYSMYSYAKGTCPAAHKMSERILSLPMHLNLTYSDVKMIVGAVLKYAEK